MNRVETIISDMHLKNEFPKTFTEYELKDFLEDIVGDDEDEEVEYDD